MSIDTIAEPTREQDLATIAEYERALAQIPSDRERWPESIRIGKPEVLRKTNPDLHDAYHAAREREEQRKLQAQQQAAQPEQPQAIDVRKSEQPQAGSFLAATEYTKVRFTRAYVVAPIVVASADHCTSAIDEVTEEYFVVRCYKWPAEVRWIAFPESQTSEVEPL